MEFCGHNMDSSIAGGRRRAAAKTSVEDQALDQIAKEVSLIHYLSLRY